MHATSYINPHRNYGGKVSLVPAGVSLSTTPSERTPYNNELALYPAYRYTTSTITAPRPALLTDLDVTSLLRDVPASPVEERFSAHCGSLRFPTGKSLTVSLLYRILPPLSHLSSPNNSPLDKTRLHLNAKSGYLALTMAYPFIKSRKKVN